MKRVLISLVLFTSIPLFAGYVHGYYRNGEYVQPYQRTAPDNNIYNNYGSPSTLPNGMQNYEKPYPYNQ